MQFSEWSIFVEKLFELQEACDNLSSYFCATFEKYDLTQLDTDNYNIQFDLNNQFNTPIMQWCKYLIDNRSFVNIVFSLDGTVTLKSTLKYTRTPFNMTFLNDICIPFFKLYKEISGHTVMTATQFLEMFYCYDWEYINSNTKPRKLIGWVVNAHTVSK